MQRKIKVWSIHRGKSGNTAAFERAHIGLGLDLAGKHFQAALIDMLKGNHDQSNKSMMNLFFQIESIDKNLPRTQQ